MEQIWYGGDYNPEQWPREVWDEDVRLMQRAGVTVATVGVFSWALLEPEDGVFDFEWLDDILDRLHAGGIRVDLATATASPPPWLTVEHPEVLPVTADGVRLAAGSRQQYSPNSAVYRQYSRRLVRALAERYGTHPALETWHVNNELACHVIHDYSDESAAAFRAWLQQKYGSIERLNFAWGTPFWSQRYGSFEQIMPPRAMPTFTNPTQQLDFDRFSSDAWLEIYRGEAEILREVTPDIPITTNFMGFFVGADYWAWAKDVDFVSDDHYPDPADPEAPALAAMTRDLMRSLGNGAPWILMEQTTSAVNWRARNATFQPGEHRNLSLQAVARGADGVMQFQWRQSVAGAEKFHSAMLPHAGEHTRVFSETVELGAQLGDLADIIGARVDSSVAIVFDWDSWWAHTQYATPTRVDYVRTVFSWYRELWALGVTIDFVHPGSDFSAYEVIFAPVTVSMTSEQQQSLAQFTRDGGTLVATYLTATLDENLHVASGGYLGRLRDALGISIEEFSPPAEPSFSGGPIAELLIDGLGAGTAREWGEVVRVDGASVVSRFVGGMLDGRPAITRNEIDAGVAWYVATMPDGLREVVSTVLARHAPQAVPPAAVEVVQRGTFRFIINHGETPVTFDGHTVAAHDTVIIRR